MDIRIFLQCTSLLHRSGSGVTRGTRKSWPSVLPGNSLKYTDKRGELVHFRVILELFMVAGSIRAFKAGEFSSDLGL